MSCLYLGESKIIIFIFNCVWFDCFIYGVNIYIVN